MIIDDIETARKALEKISYYRLSGYSYPFRQYDKAAEHAPISSSLRQTSNRS